MVLVSLNSNSLVQLSPSIIILSFKLTLFNSLYFFFVSIAFVKQMSFFVIVCLITCFSLRISCAALLVVYFELLCISIIVYCCFVVYFVILEIFVDMVFMPWWLSGLACLSLMCQLLWKRCGNLVMKSEDWLKSLFIWCFYSTLLKKNKKSKIVKRLCAQK